MFPPTYLGNIREHHETVVTEGERWTIDLENYFDHPDDEPLIYRSNTEEIKIYNQSWAV